jgi:hypothetical protein
MPGYSGTPLPKKLGLKPGMTLVAVEAPDDYKSWLGEISANLTIVSTSKTQVEAAHIFATRKTILKNHLVAFRKRLEQSGFVWVSWPKRASKVQTDITEDVIRELALPLGYVDIKVCAVNDVWSGLKLVIRKSERSA